MIHQLDMSSTVNNWTSQKLLMKIKWDNLLETMRGLKKKMRQLGKINSKLRFYWM